MKHLRLISLFIFSVALFGCQSSGKYSVRPPIQLQLDEANGIKSYQRAEFKQAFELLKQPAELGLKGAQYTIAMMFLKGQHLQQSTVLGMAWLGVANEVKTEDWSEQYQMFYSLATPEQKRQIDKKLQDYIERYGMKAQYISCTKSRRLFINNIKHACVKYNRLSQVYEMELVDS